MFYQKHYYKVCFQGCWRPFCQQPAGSTCCSRSTVRFNPNYCFCLQPACSYSLWITLFFDFLCLQLALQGLCFGGLFVFLPSPPSPSPFFVLNSYVYNQRRDLESISWVLLMAIPARKETSYWQAWGGGFTGLSNNRSWFPHLWCVRKWDCRVAQSAWTWTAVPGKEKSVSWPEDCSGDGARSLLGRAFCLRYYRNEAKCKPEITSSENYPKNKWAFESNIRARYLCTSLLRNKSVCLLLRVTISPCF